MRNQKEVERRVKILGFWEEHKEKATKDAFNVSRRTLFRWKGALRKSDGKLPSLDPQSTAPKNRRSRTYDYAYLEKVITLRRDHPRLGKKKMAVLLKVSESYAGRTISDLKKRGLLPPQKKLSLHAKSGRLVERNTIKRKKIRRPKGERVIEVDTVVRFVNGIKRYIVTGIDTETRFAFAAVYKNHSSASATDFLLKYRSLAPVPAIQTDNGSEFAALFSDACIKLNITQYHIYPRSPRMNGHVERFNRTLSEEFIVHHRMLLATDMVAFNEKLIDYLLWYNAERPHEALFLKSPLQGIVASLSAGECQRYWTCTDS
jgi:transposase InsO family protein